MTADDLRALSVAATPGPWTISHRCYGKTEMDDESCGLGLEIDQWDEPMRGHISLSADARLTVWLRNHANALADLIDAASDHHHTECLLHDTRWGGVDTCDNLGVTPADSRRCPNCRLRDALAALEAAPARLAEVTAERDRLAAAIKAIPRHRRGNDPCTYGACMVCAAPWPCPTENVRAALAALDADALADLIGAVHAFRDDLRQDPLDGAWVATSATVDGIDAALAALDGTP